MTESIPGAKRLKGELPAGTVVAHKTGTGGTRNGIIKQIPAEDGTKRLAYRLTKKGKALGPVLKAMRDWGLTWDKSTRVLA